MTYKYDAVIIGSGIGGSGVGALLAHAGWKVLVLEKNGVIGGRCTSFKQGDFTIDLGMHNYAGGSLQLGDICRLVNMPAAIEWISIRDGHNAVLQFGDNRGLFTKRGMLELVKDESERKRLIDLFSAVVKLTDEDLEKLWYVPMSEWIDGFSKNPVVHLIIDNLVGQYLCVPPHLASAHEFLKPFQLVLRDRLGGYPKGGNVSIPKAYIGAVEKYRGEVRLNSEVKNIIIEGSEAVGVRLVNGDEVRAPVVISNADIKSTVKYLVGEDHFPGDYVRRIMSLTYSDPAVTLKVLLKEKVIDEYMVIYIPDEFHPTYTIAEDMRKGKVPKWVGAVSFITSNLDPSLAPEGKQWVSFVAACPAGQDWEKWEKVLLDNFYRVHPQCKGRILRHYLETPDWLDAWAGEGGSIIGIGQTVNQVHEHRPSAVSPIKGLYYCSADVGKTGIGTELAANSAIELFKVLSDGGSSNM